VTFGKGSERPIAMDNPYVTPKAALRDTEGAKSFWFSAVLAFCSGVGAAFALQTLLGVITSWIFIGQGVRVDDLYSAMANVPALNVISLVINLLSACLAGATVSRLTDTRSFGAAAWVGTALVLFVCVQFVVPYEHSAPTWAKAWAVALPIPGTLLGAAWWLRRRSS
jgi:hypothetical protein